MDKSGTRTNGAKSGSRYANFNNATSNSNWNIGLRAACDDTFSRSIRSRPLLLTQRFSCGRPYHPLRQIHNQVKRASSSETSKDALAFLSNPMSTKHRNLIEQIANIDNLYLAYHKASRGKKYSAGHLAFVQHLSANLAMLRDAIIDGTYRPSEPRVFWVHEPKLRQISALPFADRVVQHALCNVIEPVFEQIFLPNSYACRKGKGTHAAVKSAQAAMRQGYTWVLKMDFSKFFASVDREVLHTEIRRKIACAQTLRLIEHMVPVTGKGINIGNLTSQLFANLYGHIWDRFITHKLHLKRWIRYMDDTVIFAHSREVLAVIQYGLKWVAEQTLKMKFSRWSITPVTQGVAWLGYRVWPTHKLLLPASVTRAKRKLARYERHGLTAGRDRFLAAWTGHARWANSYNLFTHLGVSA
jgi:RNA-directed DNA polymerase